MDTTAKTKRLRSQIFFTGAGRTKQAHKDECDINLIMQKFQATGVANHVNTHQANYGFASSLTFQDAMQTVATGESMFAELPSSLRAKFHHSPREFLEFVQNPENTGEMADLGLLTPEATKAYIVSKKAAEALPAIPVIDEKDLPAGEIPGD